MERIDVFLVNSGKVRSRTLAAKMIEAGVCLIDGKKAEKPSEKINGTETIELLPFSEEKYVSRGGLKLEEALRVFKISVEEKECVDIGASTGGFTDCLLQNGAKSVCAVDSGTNQLAEKLRRDPRVAVFENTNARELDFSFGKFDVAVMDVSFISQTLLYPAVGKILKENGVFISLIKPQFEAGKENIGKGGIVKEEKIRMEVLKKIAENAEKNGFRLVLTVPSPIKGGDGNKEYLALFNKIGYYNK